MQLPDFCRNLYCLRPGTAHLHSSNPAWLVLEQHAACCRWLLVLSAAFQRVHCAWLTMAREVHSGGVREQCSRQGHRAALKVIRAPLLFACGASCTVQLWSSLYDGQTACKLLNSFELKLRACAFAPAELVQNPKSLTGPNVVDLHCDTGSRLTAALTGIV